MKLLTEWALLMYPREWRRRYGVELQCLLEDSGASRGRDVFDILRGGLIMRYTGTNVIRMAMTWGITCALVGLLVAGGVALAMPDRYRADTLVVGRVRAAQDASPVPASKEQMWTVVNRAINDDRLTRIVAGYGLYGYQVIAEHPYQQGQDPAQDLAMSEKVAQFRRDILVRSLEHDSRGPSNGTHGVVTLMYSYPIAPLTAQVANQLAATIVEEGLKESAGTGSFRVVIASPARIPEKPYRPNRILIVADGLAGGALLGIIIALVRRRPMQLAG
jgi:hypothetical protein